MCGNDILAKDIGVSVIELLNELTDADVVGEDENAANVIVQELVMHLL